MSVKHEPVFGQLITDGEKQRDAIHIAVAPVTAAHHISPGERVGFVTPGDTEHVGVDGVKEFLGIVDPFLRDSLRKGERFWLFLFPNTITNLRHIWTHPAFSKNAAVPAFDRPSSLSNDRKSLAEKWMRDYAARVPVDYDELLSRAAMYVKHGTYWCDEMRFISEILPAEFWTYYEMITDQDVPESKRGDFYSCSC